MPLQVLQPVRRRPRRRRRLLPLVVVLTVVAAAGAGAAAWWLHFRTTSPAAPVAAPRPAAPAPAKRVPARPRTRPPRPAPLLFARAGYTWRTKRLAPTARAAILVDADTGRVLWGRSPHERLHIASTTKIMTALLALEHLRPTTIVRVAKSVPRVALLREGLRAGDRVPAWKLLYGLMLFSGNDDALALAVAVSGSRPAFVRAMNAKARALGLVDTHFSSPSGVVDRDNYSTAWDLAALSRYAMRSARFRAIVRTRVKHVRWAAPVYEKVYVNKNPLLGRYRGADGVKTGWTTLAGHAFVASARRRGMRLLAVVLHSADPVKDVRSLLDYGFRTRG